jgi:hypothetical protein
VIDNLNVLPYPATLLAHMYHLSRFWPIVILRHSSFTIAKLALQKMDKVGDILYFDEKDLSSVTKMILIGEEVSTNLRS